MFSPNISTISSRDTNLISESICMPKNPSNKNDLSIQSGSKNSVSSNEKLNLVAANKISDLHEKCQSKIELANSLCRKNLLSLYKNSQINCSSNCHGKDSTQHLEFVVYDGSDEDDRSDNSNEFDDESDATPHFINPNELHQPFCCIKNKIINNWCEQYSKDSEVQNHLELNNLFSSQYKMSNRGTDSKRLYGSGNQAMRELYVRYKVRSLGMQLMTGCLGVASLNESNRKPSLMDICNNQDDSVESRFNLIIEHVQDTLTQLQKICDGDYLSDRLKQRWNTTQNNSHRSNINITGNFVNKLPKVTMKTEKHYVINSEIAYKDILQAEALLQSVNIEVYPQRKLSKCPLLRSGILILCDRLRAHINDDVIRLPVPSAIVNMISEEAIYTSYLIEILKYLKKPRLLAITWLDEQNHINELKEECLDVKMVKNVLENKNKIICPNLTDDRKNVKISDVDNNQTEFSTSKSNDHETEFDNEYNLNENTVMDKDDIKSIDDHLITKQNFSVQTIEDCKLLEICHDKIGITHEATELKSIDFNLDNDPTVFSEKLSATLSKKQTSDNTRISSSFMDFLTRIHHNDVENINNILSNGGLDNLKMTMRKLSMQTALPETITEEKIYTDTLDTQPDEKQKLIENNIIEDDSEKSRSEKRLKQIKEKRKKRKLDSAENQKEIYRVVKRGEGYNPLCTSTSVTRLSISNKSFYNTIYGSNSTKRLRNVSSKKDDSKLIKISNQMSKHFASKEFDKKKTTSDLNTNVRDVQSSLKRHKMKRKKVTTMPPEVNQGKFAAMPYTLQCGDPSNYVMEQCSGYNSNDNASNSDGNEEVTSNNEKIISMYNIESDNTSTHSSVTSISNKFIIKDTRTHVPTNLDIRKHNFASSIDPEKTMDVKMKSQIPEKDNSKCRITCKKTIHKVYNLMKQIDNTFQPTKPPSKNLQNQCNSKCIKTNISNNDTKKKWLDDKTYTTCDRKITRSKEEYISSVPKVFINAKKHSANSKPSHIPTTSDMEFDQFEKVVKKFSYHLRRNENKVIHKNDDSSNVSNIDSSTNPTLENKLPSEQTPISINHMFDSIHKKSCHYDIKQNRNKFRQISGNLHKITCHPSLNTVHEANEETGNQGIQKSPVRHSPNDEKNLNQIRRQITELRDEVKEAYGEAVRGPTLNRIDFLSQPKKRHRDIKKSFMTGKKNLNNFPTFGKVESIQIGEHRLRNRSHDSDSYLDIQAAKSVTYSSGDVRNSSPQAGHRPQTSPRPVQHSLEQKNRKNHEHEISRNFQGRKKITQSCPSIPRSSEYDPYVKITSTSSVRNRASTKLHCANKKIKEIFKYVGELKPIIEMGKKNYNGHKDYENEESFMRQLEAEQTHDADTSQLINTKPLRQEEFVEGYDRSISNSGNGDNDISTNPNNLAVNERNMHEYLIPYNGNENIVETVNILMPHGIYNFAQNCNNLIISSILKELEHAFNVETHKNTVSQDFAQNRFHIPKMICTPNHYSSADLSASGGDASSTLCQSKSNITKTGHHSVGMYKISNSHSFVNHYSNMFVIPECIVNVAYSTDSNDACGSKSPLNEMRIEYVLFFEAIIMYYPNEYMICHHIERTRETTIGHKPVEREKNICNISESTNIDRFNANIFSLSKFVCMSNIYDYGVKHCWEMLYLRVVYERIVIFEMISLPHDDYLKLCDSYSTYSVYLSSDGSVEIQNINLQNSSRSDIASVSPSSTETGVSVICRFPNYTSNNLGTSVHNVFRTQLCNEISFDQIMNKKSIIDIFHNGKCGRKKILGCKIYRPKFENSCCYRAVRDYKRMFSKESNMALGLQTRATNTSYTTLTCSTKSKKLKKGVLISVYVTLFSTVFALLVIPDVINQQTVCETSTYHNTV